MYEKLKDINILYVEDDDFVREQTSMLLNSIFNNIYTANNGETGIQEYELYHNEIDVIVTDLNMPKLSGIQMAKVLNAKESVKNKIPIIAISAYSYNEYGIKEVQENFSYYIKKPIQIKDLINTIIESIEDK